MCFVQLMPASGAAEAAEVVAAVCMLLQVANLAYSQAAMAARLDIS